MSEEFHEGLECVFGLLVWLAVLALYAVIGLAVLKWAWVMLFG